MCIAINLFVTIRVVVLYRTVSLKYLALNMCNNDEKGRERFNILTFSNNNFVGIKFAYSS